MDFDIVPSIAAAYNDRGPPRSILFGARCARDFASNSGADGARDRGIEFDGCHDLSLYSAGYDPILPGPVFAILAQAAPGIGVCRLGVFGFPSRAIIALNLILAPRGRWLQRRALGKFGGDVSRASACVDIVAPCHAGIGAILAANQSARRVRMIAPECDAQFSLCANHGQTPARLARIANCASA